MIKNVTVAGGGVLGSQIAYQTAFKGFPVCLYDISDTALTAAKKQIKALKSSYSHDLHVTEAEFNQGYQNLHFTSNLAVAVKNADLVIEAIPEKLAIKESFYKQLSQVAPKKTIFASNSSSLLPSQLAGYTDRPQKYLHLHFANQIWLRNTAEIMGSKETSAAVFAEIADFASQIGMVPIPLSKEQPGYVLNAVLIPWLNAALKLWAKGIASPQTIDRTWMIDLGAPYGPFAILDVIGLRTHYNIVVNEAAQTGDEDLKLVAKKMKGRIDANLLGPATGQGFYHWPHPECLQPNFLKASQKN